MPFSRSTIEAWGWRESGLSDTFHSASSKGRRCFRGAHAEQESLDARGQSRVTAAGARGEMPLDYMIRVMCDPTTEPHRREAMPKAAAPFHPQLAAKHHRRQFSTALMRRVCLDAEHSGELFPVNDRL